MATVSAWVALIVALIAVISGISALILSIFRRGEKAGITSAEKIQMMTDIKNIKDLQAQFSKKLDEVNACAQRTATQIEPWWNLINTNLPHLLDVSHSENLVAKLTEDRITDDELVHLEQEVQEMLMADKKSGGNVFVDIMALWLIAVKKNERKHGKISEAACNALPGGV